MEVSIQDLDRWYNAERRLYTKRIRMILPDARADERVSLATWAQVLHPTELCDLLRCRGYDGARAAIRVIHGILSGRPDAPNEQFARGFEVASFRYAGRTGRTDPEVQISIHDDTGRNERELMEQSRYVYPIVKDCVWLSELSLRAAKLSDPAWQRDNSSASSALAAEVRRQRGIILSA